MKERHLKMSSVSSKVQMKSTISGQTLESDEDNTDSKNEKDTKENNEITSNNENNSVIVEESDVNDWYFLFLSILYIYFYKFCTGLPLLLFLFN